jgi:hypothetical protein
LPTLGSTDFYPFLDRFAPCGVIGRSYVFKEYEPQGVQILCLINNPKF